jgi:hypothetical protein
MDKVSINKELEYDAIYHIDECKNIKQQLIEEKNLLILAKVDGVEIGLCDNDKFIELLDNEITQAQLCLENKSSKFSEFLFCT